MNIKSFFLFMILVSFLPGHAEQENITREKILQDWEQTRQFVLDRNEEGSFILKADNHPHIIEQQQIIFLAGRILFGTEEYDRNLAHETLKFACKEKADIVVETLDYLLSNKNSIYIFQYIPAIVNAGADVNQLKDVLQTRKKSLNCNNMWSKIFGQNSECQEIEKSCSLLEKLQQEKIAQTQP